MLGVVLCGGESRRMGKDKGMLLKQGTTWAQTAFERLSILKFPVLLSVNEKQFTEYSHVFDPSLLITDDPSLNVKGPLCGMLSVHLHFPGEDLFALACDMLLMDPGILYQLAESYIQNRHYGAFVFVNGGSPEPLCAIDNSAG